MNPQDVVDTANTLSEQSKFPLWVLAELDALMHRSGDVCLAQELVSDGLPRFHSESVMLRRFWPSS